MASLKIELFTTAEVLHYTEAKYFFSQNYIFDRNVSLLMFNESTPNKTSVFFKRLCEVIIKASTLWK